MSEYSERYTIQELRDMGEKNRLHVLGEENFNKFEDNVMHPQHKTAAKKKVSHPHGKDHDEAHTQQRKHVSEGGNGTTYSFTKPTKADDDNDDEDKKVLHKGGKSEK